MSRHVDERVRELEADVQHLRFLPAAAVRARGRRRSRRQLAAVLTAGAAVTATASTVFAWPHQHAAPVADQAAGRPFVSCVVALPDDPAEVRIRVLDGGAPAELRDAATAQLRTRGFAVQTGTTDRVPTASAAALRYGPAAIGSATVVRAELNGQVAMTFDPDRPDATIDLAVGSAFAGFATPTEINANLALAGEPSAPPQCSAVASRTPTR
ncbi:LytR C-terminal domain-containing protein [Actinoplanes sp. NPDC051343]|uniref:LytR C-terminal domain-containing protein n=1 Tax=Actinoplanes sp. NPDC051343 TaxID=3363906 RepID=UPI00378D5A86